MASTNSGFALADIQMVNHNSDVEAVKAAQDAIHATKLRYSAQMNGVRSSVGGRASNASISASASAFKKSLSSAVYNYGAQTHASTTNLNNLGASGTVTGGPTDLSDAMQESQSAVGSMYK